MSVAHEVRGSGWQRVSRARPCSICGRTTWCGYREDASATICMRVGDPARSRPTRNGGHLYASGEATPDLLAPRPIAAVRVPPDWSAEVAAAQAVTRSGELEAFAAALGVTVEPLRLLGAFRSRRWPSAWCFPLFDARGRVVGVRVRARDGSKWSAPGGAEGLFLPDTVPGAGPLLLPEGPTSTAAVLTLGAEAAGRPSARPGALALAALLTVCHARDVVVVAEHDRKPDGRWPGREGAEYVAGLLRRVTLRVRIAYPPAPCKDLRDALRAGLTHEGLRELIERAPAFEPEPARQAVTP